MIGGVTGWADEGFAFAEGVERGSAREIDAARISWASVVATAMERPLVSSYNRFQHE